jgi:hypothetical protein
MLMIPISIFYVVIYSVGNVLGISTFMRYNEIGYLIGEGATGFLLVGLDLLGSGITSGG